MTLRQYGEDFDLGGGRHRLSQQIKPIAYERNGVLARITDAIGASGDVDLPLGVDELVRMRCRNRLGGLLPHLFFGRRDSYVTLRFLDCNNVNAQVTGNVVMYPGAWNNADLRLTMGGHRLQKDILLRTGHPTRFRALLNDQARLDLATLSTPDFRILPPLLVRDGYEPVLLTWQVGALQSRSLLTVDLPAGDWSGWTLDPTLTLQPDASAGIDTYTYRNAADTSYGTSNLLSLRGVGSTSAKVALLKFDLSALAKTTITSGTLSLYVGGIVSASVSLSLHRVLAANADWSESSTWNYCVASSQRWAGDSGGDGGADAGCSQAGTDYASTSMGSLTWPSGEAVGTEFSGSLSTAELATLVANNYGLALVSPYDTANLNVCSSDHTTATYRPLLVVEYTEAGGSFVFPARRRWLRDLIVR